MSRSVVLLVLLVAACSKKDATTPASTAKPETGSAMAGSGMAGSAMTGSAGSAMTGSDQAMSGSGSGSGSGSAEETAAGGGSGAEEMEHESEFDKLTQEQKIDFMKKKVMPPMKAAFQKFDPKEYKNFSCKTCHGKDPKKSKYKMPNPDLPKLDFAKLKVGKQAPEMAEFMEKTVKPQMAKILGAPEYTPQNPKGFGCLDCHEAVK